MFALNKYDYISDKSFMVHSFFSNGPQGTISKIAAFNIIDKREKFYNFGFGDFDGKIGGISDTIVSDNKDIDLIMGTVASIIYDFTNVFPESLILIQGSDKVRTRLYQININKYWLLIEPVFKVSGFLNGQWEPFRKGVNYDAFQGRRKVDFNN